MLDASYKYTSGTTTKTGPKCLANYTTAARNAPIAGYAAVYNVTDTNLMALANQHTFAIAVDASNWSNYRNGTFSLCSTNVNHAVVIVGYSYTPGSSSNYWIVRNSWGTTWGLSGYMRLLMGSSAYGTCGMKRYAPSFPVPL
jgi:C1A family cysteine protease